MKHLLLLLLTLCCVLCPAQGEVDDVQIDYQRLYCAGSTAATQEYIQQEPFTQLSQTDQHNYLINIYSFSEQPEITKALMATPRSMPHSSAPSKARIGRFFALFTRSKA